MKKADDPQPGAADTGVPTTSRSSPSSSTKTPFYEASNASRYQRQDVIRKVQAQSGRSLICYVAGIAAPIDRDDLLGIVDLLHRVQAGADLDLLLHTPGGDIDAAEKLILTIRNTVGTATLRIVVPDFAKSAGTMMAVGADRIVMSDTSELGPIDPQVALQDGKGNRIWHSVQHYLDAYQAASDALKVNPSDVPAQIMLGKLDPATIKKFESLRDRARRIAEDQLKLGMFRNGGNNTKTASELINTKKWLSHGQMISWQDAKDPSLELVVDYLAPRSDEWQQIWHLYCLQRLAVNDTQKLFESEHVSIAIDVPTS
jgi:ATP-dependent protease ClpP protease subunit